MRHFSRVLLLALAVAVPCRSAHAASITPTYDSFGLLAGATFGGTGIPNDAVAITTLTDGGVTIVLGFTAHERFSNAPVTNDGAGTFFAEPGANYGDPLNGAAPIGSPGTPPRLGATWNFAFYVSITGGTFADYNVNLLYDFDPAADTEASSHGILSLDGVLDFLTMPQGSTSLVQGSENLAFAFLSGGFPFITAPGGAFNPNALGEYTFALRLFNATSTNGIPLGQSAIQVNVGTVPEPTSLLLFGTGLAAAGMRRYRRKKQ